MPKFILSYQQPRGYTMRTDDDTTASWMAFFETIGDHVVEPGQPVFQQTELGATGDGTQLGGYSIVEAASLEDAVALAKHSPTLSNGGGVQVGELADLPPEHPASQLKARFANR